MESAQGKQESIIIVYLTEYDIACIEKAKTIIDADLSTHYTIGFLSRKVGMGETRLKKAFKRCYGTGMFNYRHTQRMIKAAKLLRETHKSIKEIARATGFKYSNNFTASFTAYAGMSPRQYRDHHQRN